MYPTPFNTPGVKAFAEEIDTERARQIAKFGEQHHPDGTGCEPGKAIAAGARIACQLAAADGTLTWRHVLREEVAEAFEETDPTRLRAELLQVAAVCAAWIWDIDNRPSSAASAPAPGPESCGKCKQPYDETDTRFWGSQRRFKQTQWCCGCVDRCHDAETADHACVICR